MTNTTTPTDTERRRAAREIASEAGFWNPGETLDPLAYDDAIFDAGAAEFLVLTDDEADERTADYVRETLWAFRPEFLVAYVPDGVTVDILEMISEKCEDGNEAMLGLVGDRLDDVIGDAISSDGRGHFLSGYDGEEIEVESCGRTWYGYRTN